MPLLESKASIRETLQVGDILLYHGTGFFDRIVGVKTWSPFTHVEVYMGKGKTYTSRPGEGCNIYDLREEGLVRVLRPKAHFDAIKASLWFQRWAKGQPYDYLGILAFFLAVEHGPANQAQFCSEVCTRILRQGGVEPFTPDTDADRVAPADFAKSGAFTTVLNLE